MRFLWQVKECTKVEQIKIIPSKKSLIYTELTDSLQYTGINAKNLEEEYQNKPWNTAQRKKG